MMQSFPMMKALDENSDGALSAEEIAAAHQKLLTLDVNKDGNLTTDEITPEASAFGEGRGRRRGPPMGPGGILRMLPVMIALDLDRDGELFEDEVSDAAVLLRKLDEDADGMLSASELQPIFGRRPGGGARRGGRTQRAGGPVQPQDLDRKDGVAEIKDRATFKEMSYQGDEVLIDTHLRGVEYVKFQIENAAGDKPTMYFMNTKTHRAHMMFSGAIGLARGGYDQMRGVLVYRPLLKSPSGRSGHYTFEFEPEDAYEFELVQVAFKMLEKTAPILRGNLSYHLLPTAKRQYLTEFDRYYDANLPVFEESSEQYAGIAFLPLHQATSFGRLRLMKTNQRPGIRDVVLYSTLPNEMPRVAGVITAVRQTPLSHVNLRAVQDNVPNAFIANALENAAIQALIGKYVKYTVAADGYQLREADAEEVEAHFASLRPASAQLPPRDLSVKEIRALDDIGFSDSARFGVKAANLAALRKLGLRKKLIPNGYAVPFSFYDEFMRHNGLYAMAQKMMAAEEFKKDANRRDQALQQFRAAIKDAEMPQWALDALAKVRREFPKGKSIRCRSSTNNEDLPGFSGAGLYDSFTHKKGEGHLAKSIKQVYASAWNYRAFEEREFYRVDHLKTAMGVLLHRNQKKEQANGVAVTQDILYDSAARGGPRFYVNAQVGEDLVTNPDSEAAPEEILLSPRNPRTDTVVRTASRVEGGGRLLSQPHLLELRRALRTIEKEFRNLYEQTPDAQFAMEIEFKITRKGKLLIKQARPWVY